MKLAAVSSCYLYLLFKSKLMVNGVFWMLIINACDVVYFLAIYYMYDVLVCFDKYIIECIDSSSKFIKSLCESQYRYIYYKSNVLFQVHKILMFPFC